MPNPGEETPPPAPAGREAQWQKALELYQRLRQAAEADDWETVEAYETERRQCLDRLLATPPTREELPRLRQLQHDNQTIRDLAARRRDEAGDTLQQLRSNRKAATAYLDQQTGHR